MTSIRSQKWAYGMVTIYGMNENVGNVSFYAMSQDQFNKPYSNETARLIDDEVRKLIDDSVQARSGIAYRKERTTHFACYHTT
jgi:AFG3 family protein